MTLMDRTVDAAERRAPRTDRRAPWTTEQFVERARQVHGDAYDYSLVLYSNAHQPVTIVCRTHGPFDQRPSNHTNLGAGCPRCNRSPKTRRQPNRVASKRGLTTAEFIERARAVHGDTYDYSQVEYEHSAKPVTIVCTTHGPFNQRAAVHMRGSGCPVCGREGRARGPRSEAGKGLRLTTEQFIERARAVHGDSYDYSQTVYSHSAEMVTIICRTHGPFEQAARSHIYKGHGCRSCRRPGTPAVLQARNMTTAEFVERARRVHGHTYGYGKSEYLGVNEPLTIGCAIHGDFQQTPNSHLYGGSGCQICARISTGDLLRMSLSRFVELGSEIHVGRYDYDATTYVDAMTPVRIGCPTHGIFEQVPTAHISGSGCPRCAVEARSLTADDLIERCSEIFEIGYDYSALPVGLTPTRSTITVGCPKHGPWEVVAGEHIRGSACPACHRSEPERRIAKVLSDHGVPFVEQWTHPTLRHRSLLRVDFMLPDSSTLVEYDGIFHFRAVRSRGETQAVADERLAQTRLRDRIKDDWAAVNGWRMVRLSSRQWTADALIAAGVLPPAEATRCGEPDRQRSTDGDQAA